MTESRQPGFQILAVALAFGLLGDSVLRAFPWGLGAALLVVALIAAVASLQGRLHTRVGPARVIYTVVAVVLAAGLVWRDAAVLKVLDVLALIATLGLLASERDDSDQRLSLGALAVRVCGTGAHTWFGAPLLVVHDVEWSAVRSPWLLGGALGAARGLVLALPVVLVFTALLAQADPVFAFRLGELVDVDVLSLIGHLSLTLVYGWLAAGYLRAAVLRDRPAQRFLARPAGVALGRIEIVVLLGSLDLLFSAFVWIQLRYLFGGTLWVQQVAGLTYSEYARRGFFELVTVVALVLPLLLAAHWLFEPKSRSETRTFGVLAGFQVVLVLVMLASALERMRLYRAEYGLTQQRFYSTAFMAWLGVLLVWFLVTVPRGKRDAFAAGVLVSGFATLVLLHVVDPEDTIVRANASLPRVFDVKYALTLGADAAPALLEAVPRLDPERRAALARGLLARWSSATEGDWRTFSVSRARAHRAVGDVAGDLELMAGGGGAAPAQGQVTP